MYAPPRRGPGHEQRGAILILVLVCLVALLGMGGIAMISAKNETAAAGAGRFQDTALNAAESGIFAAIESLRGTCDAGGAGTLYTQALGGAPWSGYFGNCCMPANADGCGVGTCTTANPFDAVDPANRAWYMIKLSNNQDNPPNPIDGTDRDGVIRVTATGYGPGQTQAVIVADVQPLGMNVNNVGLLTCPTPPEPFAIRSWTQQ